MIMDNSHGKPRNFQITTAPICRIILKIYVCEIIRVHKERRNSVSSRSVIKGNQPIMKGTLLQNKVPSSMYLPYHSRRFSATPQL